MNKTLFIKGFNPEPWTAPQVSVGRAGGKTYPRVHKSARLAHYQDGIRESVMEAYPNLEMAPTDQPLVLVMMFWRQLESYTSGKGKAAKRHVADATNCSKALEDALQGVLYKNDSQIAAPLPIMVEQANETEPLIVVSLMRWNDKPLTLPDHKAMRWYADHHFDEAPAIPGNVLMREFVR